MTSRSEQRGPGRAADAAGFTARTTPVVPPVYTSVTYLLDEQSYQDIQQAGGLQETWYSRFSNPTVEAAAEQVRRLELAPAAAMSSSGMAAIATTLLTLCHSGDRVVAARELYGDTRDLLVRDLPALGIGVDFVDVADTDGWRRALTAGPVAVAYAETLSNPVLRLLDVPTVAELAHAAGARLVVDNTFATPYAVRPLELGADVVVASATKFLNGHSDLIAGAVLGDRDTVLEVRRRIVTFGGCLDPHPAALLWRGLQTFDVRLARQTATAARVARFLEAQPEVRRVVHPSLPSYPYRDVAERLAPGGLPSAMVAFTVAGGDQRALALVRRLRLAAEATSLGGVETLVSLPFNSSHFSLSEAERQAAGIEPGTVRLSVGLEAGDALVADLADALDATSEREHREFEQDEH